jgi:hypothetical protein
VNEIQRGLTQPDLSMARAIVVAATATFIVTEIMVRAIIGTAPPAINRRSFGRSQFDKPLLGWYFHDTVS